MKMVSLKQKYGDTSPSEAKGKDHYYPSLYLDGKLCDAMGIDAVRAGTELQMVATVRVSNISENESGHRSVTLDITEAATAPKEAKPDPASVLYPNEKAG